MVLVQHRDIQVSDMGTGLTVKRYYSGKTVGEDGEGWRHQRIVLGCETTASGYEDIVFESEEEVRDLRMLAEYVATVG